MIARMILRTGRAVGSAAGLARALAILVALAWPGAPAGAAGAVPQVVLIQNSGWMEPFLTAPGSEFRPLLKALTAAVGGADGPVTVASFSQAGQVEGRPSPHALYTGPYDPGRVAAAIDAIDLPLKTGSRAYADADFDGALIGAIRGLLGGRAGVIWMATNNKNSPSNSREVQANTAAFAARLREAEAIPRIVAYPVRMPLRGRNFAEGGFVVYGIGYGVEGGRALDAALAGPGLRALFSHPPVGLKPVLDAGLDLRIDAVDTGRLRAGTENGVLVVRGADAAEGAALRLTGRLHNGLYPQAVARADLGLTWTELGASANLAAASVSPTQVRDLAPGADSGALAIDLRLPPLPRPPGLAGLLARDRVVDGTLAVRLTDMRLELDAGFVERIRPIFAGDLLAQGEPRDRARDGATQGIEARLPPLFLDFKAVSRTISHLPVRIEVAYSPWPLIGLGAGGLVVAAGAGLAAAAVFRPRTATVMLGTFPRQVTLRPYRAQALRAPDGSRWQVRAGLTGPPRAVRLPETQADMRAETRG